MTISNDNILFSTTVLGHVFKDNSIDMYRTGSMGWFDGIPGIEVSEEIGLITNHSERAQNLLIEQFKNSPNLKKLLEIYVDELQEIEDALAEIMESRNLETTIGAQLDIVGERVGENRTSSDDDEYRALIYFRVFLNSSNGEPETLIAALRVLGKAAIVRYYEIPSATVYMVFTSTEVPPSNLLSQIECIASAGVKIILGLVITTGNLFGFGDEGGILAPTTTAGFNEEGYQGGGHFVETLD